MKSLKNIVFACVAASALVGGLNAPVVAQKSPEEIRLSPTSKSGAILLRVDTIRADQQLFFQKSGSSGFGSRVYIIEIDGGDGRDVYVARTLKPGRYRLDSIWQQNRWGLELSGNTVEFDVKPGKITYLGKLETEALLLALQREAVAAGKTVARGTSGFSTDQHGVRPEFSGRDEASLAEAKEFAGRAMEAEEGMLELGALSKISFQK